MIIEMLHHGVTVRDIDSAVAWYRRALGLELIARRHSENTYTPVLVGVPGAILEVATFGVREGADARSAPLLEVIQYVRGGIEGDPKKVNEPGSAHVAFLVDDVTASWQRAVDAGATPRSAPVDVTEGANQGGRACYLHDPDGNTIEFVQRPTSSHGH